MKHKYLIFVITIIVAAILMTTINNTHAMSNISIDKLDSWKTIVQILVIIFGAFAIVFGATQIVLESKINKIQKLENDSLKLKIAQSYERAEEAIAEQKRLEGTVLNLQIKLTETMSPRRIVDQRPFIPLRKFNRMIALIITENDPEEKEFANDLSSCLQSVGWKTGISESHISILPDAKRVPIPDGIHISLGKDMSEQSIKARDKLISILSQNFKVIRGHPPLGQFPSECIIISVGKNPNYYFFQKELKAFSERDYKVRRESEEKAERLLDERIEKERISKKR